MLKELSHIACRRMCIYKPIPRPNVNRKPLTERKNIPATHSTPKFDGSDLTKQLRAKILSTGPITVAEYMREVLTNPQGGYYMHRDVFGREGDFITSPEISQIFGELVTVWVVSEWRKLGSPTPFQIVELGPGRGTLARDVLNVLAKFKLSGLFSMHLVELSPFLSEMQAKHLCYEQQEADLDSKPYYLEGVTASGTNVYWHKRLEDVPTDVFTVVLAHEFFDALPVHKLQRDETGVWKEILIDVADAKDAERTEFRFVMSKAQTPISQFFQPGADETRTCLEYSLETERIVTLMAERMERYGGIGLIMDYGHFGDRADTFRAFKNHALHDPLINPGSADLTADVDFRHMKRIAEQHGQAICFGPVEQGDFLTRMAGEARLEQLLKNAQPGSRETLESGYKMLTDPMQMGQRFKFLSMFPAVIKDHLEKFPVNGFS